MNLQQGKLKKWKMLDPIKTHELHCGCDNCSTAYIEAPMDMIINVGFGSSSVTMDGMIIWEEQNDKDCKCVADIEAIAAADPDHDWRITRYGPMHGETFQRQRGHWFCVESNQGFA